MEFLDHREGIFLGDSGSSCGDRCLAKSLGHRAAQCRCSSNPGADTSHPAAILVCSILDCFCRLETSVISEIAKHSHRTGLIQMGLDFIGQRHAFDVERKAGQSPLRKGLVDLELDPVRKRLLVCRQIEEGNATAAKGSGYRGLDRGTQLRFERGHRDVGQRPHHARDEWRDFAYAEGI